MNGGCECDVFFIATTGLAPLGPSFSRRPNSKEATQDGSQVAPYTGEGLATLTQNEKSETVGTTAFALPGPSCTGEGLATLTRKRSNIL